MIEYVTYKNITFIFNFYNNYLAIHSIFTGFYIVYKYTKHIYFYFFSPKLICYNLIDDNGWYLL